MDKKDDIPVLPSQVEEAIAEDDKATAKGKHGWLSWTVAVIFGLLYTYDLFEAISTVAIVSSSMANTNATLGEHVVTPPWAVLVPDLLVAPVVYLAAFFIGRRQGVLAKALVFLLGLAIVAALTLSLEEGFVKLV